MTAIALQQDEIQLPAALRRIDRILIVRLSSLGDIVHAMPAVAALRVARPELEIGWLIEERWSELLCSREQERLAPRSQWKPMVDFVHPANFSTWKRALLSDESWREMRACMQDVRAQKYELALDMQGAIRSAFAARLSGARYCLGSSLPRESPARMLYTRAIDTRGKHVVEQALSLTSALAGQRLPHIQPPFPVDLLLERWAQALQERFEGKPLAILNPGAGWGAKRWPAQCYAQVACALSEQGMAVLVNHGPGEETLAKSVAAAGGEKAFPLKCSVGELIAITRRARLFIGGDTGPMHLAAALSVPVVALLGPTPPERTGPYATRYIVLRSPESRDRSSHVDRPDSGLVSIAPHAVIAAAEQLLREQNG